MTGKRMPYIGNYVLSDKGTFGTVASMYRTEETKEDMCLVRWGPLKWISQIRTAELTVLVTPEGKPCRYESEAKAAARKIIKLAPGIDPQHQVGCTTSGQKFRMPRAAVQMCLEAYGTDKDQAKHMLDQAEADGYVFPQEPEEI